MLSPDPMDREAERSRKRDSSDGNNRPLNANSLSPLKTSQGWGSMMTIKAEGLQCTLQTIASLSAVQRFAIK